MARDIGWISGDDVKRRMGIETMKQVGVMYVAQEGLEYVFGFDTISESMLLGYGRDSDDVVVVGGDGCPCGRC